MSFYHCLQAIRSAEAQAAAAQARHLDAAAQHLQLQSDVVASKEIATLHQSLSNPARPIFDEVNYVHHQII